VKHPACLFGVILFLTLTAILTFEWIASGETPFKKQKLYFSSPDSFSQYQKTIYDAESSSWPVLFSKLNDSRTPIQQNLLAIAFKCLPVSPWLLFLFNASVHAVCGMFVYLILKTLFPFTPSCAGALVFITNPTSLEWTANMLKDGVFILAILAFLLCHLKLLTFVNRPLRILAFAGSFIFSAFLIFKTRPYFLEVLPFLGSLILTLNFAVYLKDVGQIRNLKKIVEMVIILVCAGLLTWAVPLFLSHSYKEQQKLNLFYLPAGDSPASIYMMPQDRIMHDENFPVAGIMHDENFPVANRLNWESSRFLPGFINRAMYIISIRREGFLSTAGSSRIDQDIHITSPVEFALYFPRVFCNGFFSPYPDMWLGQGSSPIHTMGRRLLGLLSLAYWPLIFTAFLGSIQHFRNEKILTIFLFCITGVTLYAYMAPNLGALNRFRYGFYMLWVALGAAFMVEQIIRKSSAK